MNNIVPFEFESYQVRVIEQEGEPWFVLRDVCEVLGISNVSDAAARLDDDEKGVGISDTLGGRQGLVIVSESGLYTVILRCQDAIKPGSAPHRFRKWVTAEVLPAIRKTGRYESPRSRELQLAEAVIVADKWIGELKGQVAALVPKAQSFDQLMDSTGLYPMRNVAKILRVTNIFQELEKRGIFYRSRQGSWVPKQKHIAAKRFVVKVSVWGDNHSTSTTYATPAGLEFLRQVFGAFIDPDLFDDHGHPTRLDA